MSLRIISEPAARNLERSVTAGGRSVESLQDTYLTRLNKLLPAEAMTAYTVFLNVVPRDDAAAVANPLIATAPAAAAIPVSQTTMLIALTSWVVLIVVLVLRWSATKSPDGKAQWPAVIISGITFVIWAYVVNGSFDFTGVTAQYFEALKGRTGQYITSLVLFAWSVIVPAIYTGDRS